MDVYEERKQPISLYETGKKVSRIVRIFKKSRQWFYFWLNRYHRQDGQGEWFKGESKAPKTKPYRIGKDVEEQVIYAREKLEKQRHAQTGAVAIQYTILNLGQQPPPIWTIKRILTSSGLNKKSSQSYKKSNKDYPTVFLHTHQMDLLGPRFIKGDGRYYTVNIIDTECRSCFVRPVRTKTTADIMDILVLVYSWYTRCFKDG